MVSGESVKGVGRCAGEGGRGEEGRIGAGPLLGQVLASRAGEEPQGSEVHHVQVAAQ